MAAISCGRNSSGRRQSWASVASAFMVLKSPCTAPKSVSRPQKAVITGAGTPYSASARAKVWAYCFIFLGADLHAVGTDRALGKFEEGLAENALGAVAREAPFCRSRRCAARGLATSSG
jgi:hypothetical protein